MGNQEERGLIELTVVLSKLLKRWYVFVILLPVFLVVSKLYLKYQTPSFRVNSSLRIGASKNTGSDALLDEISPFGTVRYKVLDEVTVMKSFALAQRTINVLDLNVAYFVSGDIKKTQLYKSAPFKVVLDSGKNVLEGFSFIVTPVNKLEYRLTIQGKKLIVKSGLTDKPVGRCVTDLNGTHRYGTFLKTLDSTGFYLELMDPTWEAAPGVNYEFTMKTNNTLYNELSKVLKISSQDDKSSIMRLGMVHPLPEMAIDYMNTLMVTYCNQDYEDKLASLIRSLVFLKKQILETQSKLADREIIAQKLKEETKIYDLDAAADNTYQQILVLQQEIESLKLQENYYDLVITYIRDHRAFSDLVAPSLMGIDDPMVASIVSNLKDIYVEKARKEFSAQENNPSLTTLNLAQQKTIDIALENLNHGVKRIEFNLRSIEKQMEEKFTLLKSLPSAELNFLRVKREIDGLNNLLEFLVEREATLGINASRVSSNHQVVDYARLSSILPISPKRALISLVFLILGVLLSLVIVYLLEFFNRKVTSIKEIEAVYGNKLLGSVPLVKNPGEIDVFTKPNSLFAESLRLLKHRLDFVLPEEHRGEAKVIAVTSSSSGEGKTFLSTKLASSLAVGDYKVMLIGADLRKPKLSEYFKGSKKKGLSEFLVGLASLKEITNHSGNGKLDCIFSGEIPPNPAVLLANDHFSELLEGLKSTYDYIVIDCPPVGLISDYHALNVAIDLTLFVVKQDYSLVKSLGAIQGYNLTNPEVVFNAVKKGFLTKYSANYGYGYGEEYYEED